MKPINSITNFGATDADNDDLVFDCFEDHEAYLSLINFKKFLVIGRKGTGKTSIFKKLLSTRESDFFSFGHTFLDYPWHHHDLQARMGIPDSDKYTHSWKYLILMTLAKIVLNRDQSLPFDDKSCDYLSRIERFIIDSYGTRDPDVTQIFTPHRKLKLKPSLSLNYAGLKAGVAPESVPIEDLPIIISEVNENLTDYLLGSLNPDNRYYIAFDQLDIGFDPSNPNYANRLMGLILACRDINVKAKSLGKKFITSVFLRNDIYDELHFEDKNKITENFVSIIEWDSPGTTKTLKGLMEKRFTQQLRESQTERIVWDDVFDENKGMPGNQKKYNYILDRTFLRPRDVIKFCNEILSKHKENQTTDNKMVNDDIHEARAAYGDYFLRELDDEIRKHIPKYEEYLDIFKAIGFLEFERVDFIKIYEEKKTALGINTPAMEILKELFNFSVIGFYRAGGRGGGSEYIFKYISPRSRFDDNATKFKIHQGLLDVLELKRWKRV